MYLTAVPRWPRLTRSGGGGGWYRLASFCTVRLFLCPFGEKHKTHSIVESSDRIRGKRLGSPDAHVSNRPLWGCASPSCLPACAEPCYGSQSRDWRPSPGRRAVSGGRSASVTFLHHWRIKGRPLHINARSALVLFLPYCTLYGRRLRTMFVQRKDSGSNIGGVYIRNPQWPHLTSWCFHILIYIIYIMLQECAYKQTCLETFMHEVYTDM